MVWGVIRLTTIRFFQEAKRQEVCSLHTATMRRLRAYFAKSLSVRLELSPKRFTLCIMYKPKHTDSWGQQSSVACIRSEAIHSSIVTMNWIGSAVCCPARSIHFDVRVNRSGSKKTAGSHVALRGNFSAPVRVTDLVEVSKDSASLVVCTRKKIFCLGMRVFRERRHKWRTFWPPSPDPGRQPLGGSISLKFLLDSRLQSESFDTLMTCWGFGFKSYDLS